MIPPFNDDGYLPPGVHSATLNEIAQRFGEETELRRAQMDSIRWLVALARRVGVKRLIINGSFVTDFLEPNDVDCVMLPAADAPHDPMAASELAAGLPFIELQLVGDHDFAILTHEFFANDRDRVAKGVVEVIL